MPHPMRSLFPFAVLALALPAAGGEVGARIESWHTALSGDVKAESHSIPATRLSYSGLGMDTDEDIPSGELFARFGKDDRHRLSLRFFQQAYSGQTTLTQTVTFKTFTFAASTVLSSRMQFQDLDARYEGDFWQGKAESGSAAPRSAVWGIAGLKTLSLDAELSAPGVGTASESVTAPLPVLGLGGRWTPTPHLSLEAQAAGLAIDVSDIRASFYELQARAGWHFTKNVALQAGWRSWHLKGTIDSSTVIDFNATIQGPFLALEGRF